MPKKPLFIIGLENRLNNPTFPLAAANVKLRESSTHWKKYRFIKRKDSWTHDQSIAPRDVWY